MFCIENTPFDSFHIIGVVYHWGARLVKYWCQHQLPFVPIGIRWYRLRWYVNMNDAWTAPLMSWYYTMSMVHQHPHPVYHKAAVDQTRAYPTAVSIGTTARMIWEDCGLLLLRYEERRRRFISLLFIAMQHQNLHKSWCHNHHKTRPRASPILMNIDQRGTGMLPGYVWSA